MKSLRRYIALIISIFLVIPLFLYAQTNPNHVHVNGYYRNGTYVAPHYRTAPNSTNRDNFSTKPNYNPYTGKAGWIDPDNKFSNNVTPSNTKSNIAKNYYYNPPEDIYNKPNYTVTSSNYGQQVLSFSNGQEIFGTCKDCVPKSYDENLYYYWFSPKIGIHRTKGSLSGQPLNGIYKFYSIEGELLIQSNYKHGVEHGDFTIWNNDGDIIEEMHHTNGVLDYAKFPNDNGYIIEWQGEMFKRGSVKNIYNTLGILVENATANDDYKFHYKLYNDPNGELETEFIGFENYYNGFYKTYFKNGFLSFHGQFTDNLRDGIWQWYNEEGNVTELVKYRIYSENYPSGNARMKGSQYYNPQIEFWVRDGEWIIFEENGVDWADLKYYKGGIEVTNNK